jgi:hypothetical protein
MPPRLRSHPSTRAGAAALRRRAATVALLLAALAAACMPTPAQEMTQAELLLDMSDAVAHLRVESATLQEQVDSLQAMVARQDTLLRRLAAVTGTPLTP